MNDTEIIDEVNKYPGQLIVLTGGEPSLFIDQEFISTLKRNTGKKIAIETNGTRLLPEVIDWITVSPKMGMSDTGNPEILCEKADELKVVDIGQDLTPYFRLSCVKEQTTMLLQPCYVEEKEKREKNTRRTIQRVLKDPRWHLSLQTHRYLGVR